MRPTYRALNKILTLMGCDRRFVLCGMFIAFGLFMATSVILVGLVTFGCFAVLGRYMAKDPAALRLLFNSGSARNRYDAAIFRPFPVSFHE